MSDCAGAPSPTSRRASSPNDQSGNLTEEDRVILEAVQRGIRISDKPGIIGNGEPRIRAFMQHYKQRMALAGVA